MLRHLSPALAVIVVMAMTACSSVDCSVGGVTACAWKMYTAEGDEITPSRTVSFYAQRVASGNYARRDTLLANRIKTDASISLPMSHGLAADTMHLLLHDIDGVIVDAAEVVVSKLNTPVYESIDCDARFSHTITHIDFDGATIDGISYAGDFIDSISIINPNVTNHPTDENIRITLSPAR